VKRLYLLRHATPEPEPSGDDPARALAEAGRAEATEIGARLRALEPAPPLALVSSARRAQETFEALCGGYGSPLPSERTPALYLASADALLQAIESQDDDRDALLLVGHNPGIARLAYELLRENEEAGREQIAVGFTPATLAAISFEVQRWVEVDRGSGRMIDIARPSI
jgi:phosphohistidine phosphatase